VETPANRISDRLRAEQDAMFSGTQSPARRMPRAGSS
jgi:hypothetical protein